MIKNENTTKKRFSVKRKIAIAIVSILLCLTLVAVLWITVGAPLRENINNNNLEKIAFSTSETNSTEETTTSTSTSTKDNKKDNNNNYNYNSGINWNNVQKKNNEIVGWIKVPNTNINYPVLWHPADTASSSFYLWRNYLGEPNYCGSIFMDGVACSPESQNYVLYGHHMNDGTMFSQLMNYGTYSGNLAFYKTSPVITYHSKHRSGSSYYKIISVFKIPYNPNRSEFVYQIGSFFSEIETLDYINELKYRSIIDCPVKVNEKDKFLTLTTCSYEQTNNRTVIVARQVRRGEAASVDVSKAKVKTFNKQKTYSFLNDYKKKKTLWYDGKYDFSSLI